MRGRWPVSRSSAFSGIINVLTMACMAEAITRSGTVRYGDAFVGRLVADYLGSAGSSSSRWR